MVQLSLSSKPTYEITAEYDLSPTLIDTMVKQFNNKTLVLCVSHCKSIEWKAHQSAYFDKL